MNSLTESLPRVPAAATPWIERVVRAGFFAKGLIYILIGALAARVGLGLQGGRITDASGALRTFLQQPFGTLMLWLIGIGIIGYAAYYIFEALADLKRHGGGARGWLQRSLTIVKAVVYGTIGVEALSMVTAGRSTEKDAEDNARMLMQYPLGESLLVLIGAGVAIYGISQLMMAWRGGTDDDIDAARVRQEAPWILTLGRVGVTARSVVLVLMGATLAWSGVRERPADADGYSDVLSAVASINPWLLAAMGAGLAAFGVYQLCHARYARIEAAKAAR